jgi:hypothetical protein
MSRYLVHNDRLFLGSSSACNLVACIKFVKKRRWQEGQTLVTILYVSLDTHGMNDVIHIFQMRLWQQTLLEGKCISSGKTECSLTRLCLCYPQFW